MANLQLPFWRQTDSTELASNPPASPFNNAAELLSAPVDLRQLYLPPVVVINALLIISASVQLRNPTFQNQQVRQQPLVNTSQGSPRALLSGVAVTFPPGEQQLASAPAYSYQPADIQRGSPIVLLQAVVATTPVGEQQLTSAPSFRYQPPDTSQGTPKPLYSDALFAPTNLTEQFSIIQRLEIGDDTSQGTPLTLRSIAVAAPFKLPLQTYAQPSNWQPLSTAYGTPATLLGSLKPFVPTPQAYVDRINWKGLDTSLGTFPALFPVTTAPFTPYPWVNTPSAWQQPADTSKSSSQALLNPVPFVPPPTHQAPIANRTQPADTSQGTPQPLLALLLVKPFNQNDWPPPIEYRVTWLQQWTFYGQNPDNIPPAVVVPPIVEKDFYPGIGGHKKLKERKKYLVEIDGQDFYVNSPAEAQELLAEASQIAEFEAQTQLQKALESRLKPRKLVRVVAHKLQPPVIRVPQAEVDPIAAEIEAQAREFRERITALYADIVRSAEIGLLLRRQQDDDDEQAILLLL